MLIVAVKGYCQNNGVKRDLVGHDGWQWIDVRTEVQLIMLRDNNKHVESSNCETPLRFARHF